MTEELPVHISREELHAVEVPDTFETDGTFDVVLVNHGNSLHVHLHLDDDLSRVAEIEAGNHYVEGDSERAVRVRVDDVDREVFGRLKVVSAYGAETRWVDVDISPDEEEETTVEIAESLGQPQPRTEPDSGGLADRPELLVGALAVVALLVAIGAAVLLESMLVLVGAFVVLAGVIVALFIVVE